MKIKILILIAIVCFYTNSIYCKSVKPQFEALKEEIDLFSKSPDAKSERQEVKRSILLLGVRHLEFVVANEIQRVTKKIDRLKNDLQDDERTQDEDEGEDSDPYRSEWQQDRLENYRNKIAKKENNLLELKEIQLHLERLKRTL